MCSISAAISECEAKTAAAAKTGSPGLGLKKRLKTELRRKARTIAALERDLEEAASADVVQRMGHSLMAQLDLAERGQTEVVVRDIFDLSEPELSIDLDPTQSPADNAAGYLKKAARYAKRLEILPCRLKRMQQEERALKLQLDEIERDPDSEEAIALAKRYGDEDVAQRRVKQQRDAHPRRYRTRLGWSVWAGRNNRENDILTHKIAAQNDVWFHAHGYAGSHVVLRLEGRKESPDRWTLEEAAGVGGVLEQGTDGEKGFRRFHPSEVCNTSEGRGTGVGTPASRKNLDRRAGAAAGRRGFRLTKDPPIAVRRSCEAIRSMRQHFQEHPAAHFPSICNTRLPRGTASRTHLRPPKFGYVRPRRFRQMDPSSRRPRARLGFRATIDQHCCKKRTADRPGTHLSSRPHP